MQFREVQPPLPSVWKEGEESPLISKLGIEEDSQPIWTAYGFLPVFPVK